MRVGWFGGRFGHCVVFILRSWQNKRAPVQITDGHVLLDCYLQYTGNRGILQVIRWILFGTNGDVEWSFISQRKDY